MKSNCHGDVATGFESIRSIFESILDESPTSGSALSIWQDGKNIVELSGGYINTDASTPWLNENMAVVFSCTKGLMSLAIAKLYESGRLDYSLPVATYWPEFAQNGKEMTTVRDLVAHRAGLPFFAENISLDTALDWEAMIATIESEKPYWNPGDTYAYHAITHGWLTGELIRRITGKMPGDFLREEISEPLKASTWLGLPSAKEQQVATSFVRDDLANFFDELTELNTLSGNFLIRSLTLGDAFPVTLVGDDLGFNSEEVHSAQIPGAGGISTASGLAKIWSSVVATTDGVRLLQDSTIDFVTQVQSEGMPFTKLDPPYSKFGMGFQLDSPARRYLSESSFGHDGAGGQCAFADPMHKVGFAFITNEMGGGKVEDARASTLIQELKRILEK